MVEYHEIKKSSVGDFILKFDNFVTRYEADQNKNNIAFNPSLLKK